MLLFIDGFESYGLNGQDCVAALEQAGYTASGNFSSDGIPQLTNDTRTGIGLALVVSTWSYGGDLTRSFNTSSGIVMGFACKMQVSSYDPIVSLGYNNLIGGFYTQFTLASNGSNGITILTGDNAHTYSSPPNVLFQDTWQYIELEYNPGATTSYLEVRVDGVAVIAVSGQTIVTSGAASAVNQVTFVGGQAGRSDWLLDDVYICDVSGSSFNDFLGDCVVHALLPAADAGTNQMAQTGGTGAGHFSAVDDNPPDGDISYLSSNTSGQKELFTLPTLPSDMIDVLAVTINVTARKLAAGLGLYAAVLDVGGVETASAEIPTSLGYVTQQAVFETPPGGGAWTLTLAQSATFGVKII